MRSIFLEKKEIFPSKVVCLGRNYVEHIEELNNEMPEDMIFFIKPNSSVCSHIIFPKNHKTCHYESEISFLIKDGSLYAVAFGLDLTLREVQSKLKTKGLPWERAKAFNNSAVFSQFVYLKDKDLSKLSIELYINDELRQKGDFTQMINKPEDILSEAKTFLDFEDGDILMSGTPKGVGELKIDDVFLGKILYDDKVLLEFNSQVKY